MLVKDFIKMLSKLDQNKEIRYQTYDDILGYSSYVDININEVECLSYKIKGLDEILYEADISNFKPKMPKYSDVQKTTIYCVTDF